MSHLRSSNFYESLASRFLEQQGVVILDRNFAWAGGEIDIIANHKTDLVFFEVKFRKNDAHGCPSETLTRAQMQRIRNCTQLYLEQHQLHHRYYRFDVIAITQRQSQPALIAEFAPVIFENYEINWLKSAF